MEITEERHGDVVVFVLRYTGDLEPSVMDRHLHASLHAGERKFVADVRQLRRFSSRHLGKLIRCRELARNAGGNLVVVRPSLDTEAGGCWRIPQLDLAFPQFEALDDALTFLAAPQGES